MKVLWGSNRWQRRGMCAVRGHSVTLIALMHGVQASAEYAEATTGGFGSISIPTFLATVQQVLDLCFNQNVLSRC